MPFGDSNHPSTRMPARDTQHGIAAARTAPLLSRRDLLQRAAMSGLVVAETMVQNEPSQGSSRMPPHLQTSGSYIPAAAHASYPVRGGNRVRVLIDGEPAFRRICEAVEAAKHSVWLTVAFLWPEFRLPDHYGSVFDLLDRAQSRGLDVRVLFWRPNPEMAAYEATTFSGTEGQRRMLSERGSRFLARWDRAFRGYAHHQKSWLVDAGHASETAFVGGANLNPHHLGVPGHASMGEHDVYLELAGPAATDVHHSFAQRWNEASERGEADGTWGDDNDDLSFPRAATRAMGNSAVQVQRTVHAGRYTNGHPTPDGQPFFIASGEHSILEQYLRGIAAARRSIYLEHHSLTVAPIVAALRAAVARGVTVVVLLPAEADGVKTLRSNPAYRVLYQQLSALGQEDRFALVGMAVPDRKETRRLVYVHAKIMLIDDVWTTIGSCNLHENSLFGHTEMNVAIWDAEVVRTFRCELLREHLGLDTSHVDDRRAFELYISTARSNRQKGMTGESTWQGIVFEVDPATYGA